MKLHEWFQEGIYIKRYHSKKWKRIYRAYIAWWRFKVSIRMQWKEFKGIDYDQDLPEFGDLFTKFDFKHYARQGWFNDMDGHGALVRNGKRAAITISPSCWRSIPKSATHIMWFNK